MKWIVVIAIGLLTASFSSVANEGPCEGRFPNPISDVCWDCIFPISIGSAKVPGQYNRNDPGDSMPFICVCPEPPPVFYRIGIGMTYWEPYRISEVVRTPGCSVTLDTKIGDWDVPHGTTHKENNEGKSFYQAHLFQYPVLSWFFESWSQSACGRDDTAFDLLYMTEFDSLWQNDEDAMLLMPEVVLFANPAAQLACAADSVTATARWFGLDELFWCSGSQGSVYPIDGWHNHRLSAIDTTLAKTHSLFFKLHRQGMLHDVSSNAAMCGSIPQPVMRKNQYKSQMLYPLAQNRMGLGFGVPSSLWGMGREFPYKGEDFSYLVWRRIACCAF